MDINYEVWYLNEKIFGLNEDKMNSIEKTLLSRIDKSLALLVLAGATVLAAAIRISLFPMLSLDMTVSLIPWYEEIAVNGLYQQVGNYNLVYQLLIWAMTLLPIPAPWSYKILSCVFDYLLAFSCALLVNELDKNNRPWGGIWTYTAVLICPVVFLNSAAWGQCDAIFSSFAILGLYFLLKEHYNRALLCLGLSFTFKLHAVFVLPIYLFVYFSRRKFSILRFLIVPLTMAVTASPALLWGRNLFELITVYLEQTDTFHAMALNYPSMWTLVCDPISPLHYRYLGISAVVFTVCVIAVFIVAWYRKGYSTYGKNLLIMTFILSFSCVLFLPAMHDRYGYIYEMCAIAMAVLIPSTIPLCAGLILLSLSTYGVFLFNTTVNYQLLTVINIALFFAYLYVLNAKLEEKVRENSVV